MSTHRIPPKAKAGIAFAGVELNDAWGFIASFFAGVFAGVIFGWMFYLIIPFCGYVGTKMYLEWKKHTLDGFLDVALYNKGIRSFSAAFDQRKKLFVGDSVVINPALSRIKLLDVDQDQNNSKEARNGN